MSWDFGAINNLLSSTTLLFTNLEAYFCVNCFLLIVGDIAYRPIFHLAMIRTNNRLIDSNNACEFEDKRASIT